MDMVTHSGIANNTTIDWIAINGTATPCDADSIPVEWGYICAAIAVVFYGSNFIPVKKYETGDGLYIKISIRYELTLML